MDKKRAAVSHLLAALIFIFISGALFSGGLLVKNTEDAQKQNQLMAEAVEIMSEPEQAVASQAPASPQPTPALETQEAPPSESETPEPAPTQPQLLPWCQKLIKKYPDLVGWITIGQDIYLPVVQGDDNEYYLDHAVDGSENRYGAVFLDYENNPYTLYGNNYVYGHHYQYDHENMFAPLEKYHDETYALKNSVFTYSSLYNVYECHLFSTYTIYPDDWRIYAVDFDGVSDYQAWIDERLVLSEFDFGVTASKDDRIMSLSTCDYTFQYARQIFHAVMVKIK